MNLDPSITDILTKLIEELPDYVAVYDSYGKGVYFNAAARNLFQVENSNLLPKIGDFMPDWARKIILGKGLAAALEHGSWASISAILDPAQQEQIVYQLLMTYRLQGKLYLCSICRPIQTLKTEQALVLLEKVFDTMQEGLMITDSRSVIKLVNPAFTAVTGYEPEEVVGKTPQILKSGRHDQEFYKQMWSQLISTGHWSGEVWNRRKSGEIYPEWLSISAIREGDTVTHYVAIFSDITALKLSESKLQYLANHDALTGLPNRTLFYDRFKMAIARAEKEKTKIAVLFLDLDKFKPVNDVHGHHLGDLLLQATAERLQSCVREEDTVARIGGDEFLVLITSLKKPQDAAKAAEKIIQVITQPFLIEGLLFQIGISIGISIYPSDGLTANELIDKADAAMYIAKAGGGNEYRFSSS